MSLPTGGAHRIAVDILKWVPHLIALRSPAVHHGWRNGGRRRVCWGCRGRDAATGMGPRFANHTIDHTAEWRRCYTTARGLPNDTISHPPKATTPGTNASPSNEQAEKAAATASISMNSLPSHTEKQRSAVSKRISMLMDGLLARASIASQHINAYTGTDYSEIEALRVEITQQEQNVRECHAGVNSAKSSHHDAVADQASAQREIVGLLERKSSWSPGDLERYMSLVRSEHVNEQAVQAAKDGLNVSERNLEEARSLLERLERKKYYEEQIWSDTIRRNSTWVTFGLMGLNILLLLAQIAIFEPYRRRRIVRDVKLALDEKTFPTAKSDVERAAGGTAEDPERIHSKTPDILDALIPPSDAPSSQTPAAVEQMLPNDASDFAGAVPRSDSYPPPVNSTFDLRGALESCRATVQDLFSERVVQMKRIEVMGTAVTGMAAGAALTGLVMAIIRAQ